VSAEDQEERCAQTVKILVIKLVATKTQFVKYLETQPVAFVDLGLLATEKHVLQNIYPATLAVERNTESAKRRAPAQCLVDTSGRRISYALSHEECIIKTYHAAVTANA